MVESKFDHNEVKNGLFRILDTMPSDISGWNRDSIKTAILAGEYSLALDDLASMYLYSNNLVSGEILNIFESLAGQMDIACDPEWPDVARIITLSRQ